MGRNTQYYSQKNHSVEIEAADGSWASRTLRDFFSDDSIEWEPNTSDAVQLTTGLDGARISYSSDRSGTITIHLKPTSPDVGFLTKLFNLRNTVPQLVNVTITTGVNEVHRLKNAGIKLQGGKSGAAQMSERVFSFVGEDMALDESEG